MSEKTESQIDENDPVVQETVKRFLQLPELGLAGECCLSIDEVEAIYKLGYQYFERGDLKRAHDVFNYLCLFESNSSRFWIANAAVLHKLKRWDKAIDAYSIAAILDATNIYPCFHATECLIESGQIDRAVKAMEAFDVLAEAFYPDKATIQPLIDKADIWKSLLKKKQKRRKSKG